jgi:hypothetical protein
MLLPQQQQQQQQQQQLVMLVPRQNLPGAPAGMGQLVPVATNMAGGGMQPVQLVQAGPGGAHVLVQHNGMPVQMQQPQQQQVVLVQQPHPGMAQPVMQARQIVYLVPHATLQPQPVFVTPMQQQPQPQPQPQQAVPGTHNDLVQVRVQLQDGTVRTMTVPRAMVPAAGAAAPSADASGAATTAPVAVPLQAVQTQDGAAGQLVGTAAATPVLATSAGSAGSFSACDAAAMAAPAAGDAGGAGGQKSESAVMADELDELLQQAMAALAQ